MSNERIIIGIDLAQTSWDTASSVSTAKNRA